MEEWLTAIGLAHRIAAFSEQSIALAQFPELTEDDLRELGLLLGERVRFRKALAEQSPVATPALATEPVQPSPAPVMRAERRPLTVMFVDVIDSSSLSERLDPEDLVEVWHAYRAFCGAAIRRFGGHVARYVGDGTLAYFCYPLAHENDPERAVRAARAIVDGIGDLATPAGTKLQVRIGLATGRVVISDFVTAGQPFQDTAVGSIPTLAARMQTLARPNGIVIAQQTQSRLRQRFALKSLGLVEVKGFERLEEPFIVLGERSAQDAGQADGAPEPLTGFHGRIDELAVLRRQWQLAKRGKGNVVLVTGEAGIGKSRLADQFCAEILPASARLLRLAASAFDEDSPLRPVIDHLRHLAGLDVLDPPDTARAKLETVLAGSSASRAEALPLMAVLVGIPPQTDAAPALTPEQLRERTLALLTAQLLAASDAVPLCLLVEDIHWLDPTSRDLLDRVIPALGHRRILVLLTSREGAGVEATLPVGTPVLRLPRLGSVQIGLMLRDLFAADQVAPTLVARVASKTDGVPLFVEEVARLLKDRVASSEEREIEFAHGIPASLDETLVAHLDRAGTAKQVAQIAAVIGRSVRRDVIAAVSSVPETELLDHLATLLEQGILERDRARPSTTFRFCHALLRDAAYAGLLRDQRRQLHGLVAQALVELDPDVVASQPETLALHLAEAGDPETAAAYWLEAGKRSLERSALIEGTRMLRRGLTALEALPPAPEPLRLRLQIAAALGPALTVLRGPRAPETLELYSRYYEFCREMPEEESHFPILFGWWRFASDGGQEGIARAGRLLEHARLRDDPALLLQAHHCCWASHLHVGNFAQCCQHIADGLAIYQSGDYRHHARLYGGHDAKVCAHGNQAQLLWMQGKLRAALEEERHALAWAEQMDHFGSRLHAMGVTLLYRVYRRDFVEVLGRAGRMISVTSEHGVRENAAAGVIFRGWVTAQEDPAAGLAMIENGLADQREVATGEDFPIYHCLLAEALIALGRPGEAAERMLRERPEFDRIGLRMWMPEYLNVLGRSLLAADPRAPERAEAVFDEAAALASAQGVPMLGLRIALSRARLLAARGDRAGGRLHLAEALSLLPERDDSPDFVEVARFIAALEHA